MSKITLRCLSAGPSGLKFANLGNPAEVVNFKTQMTAASRNGIKALVGRSSIVWTTPYAVKQCETDTCSPSADFTDLLRLEFSNANAGDRLINRLENLVVWLKANPTFLTGFPPSQSQDVVLGADLAG